jgi:hypothetical protein
VNRYAVAILYLGLIVAILSGCRSGSSDTADVRVEMTLNPSPPVVGDADVSLALASANGKPLAGAAVRLEGNMSHAGMKPSFADLEEVEPGRYKGTLTFTMGGDWFVLVSARTKDGRTVHRKFDVRGVKRP